ncbi:hypothetical protein NITHO_2900002 [Nitrolancea hollandica Lb]|uniref:Uncharacterized protein n=1 Tax=Nitrolancea hollandica Lb TaxID=1129897 RepID=I4EGZ4_9BACT|nr:hypothetical protein NITHO_2900002 [Nitrolancea hollandica Lb]
MLSLLAPWATRVSRLPYLADPAARADSSYEAILPVAIPDQTRPPSVLPLRLDAAKNEPTPTGRAPYLKTKRLH